VLPDDQFTDTEVSDNWDAYGDASVAATSSGAQVTRGYVPLTYADLESDPRFGTYGAMEAFVYGALEGGRAEGQAGGGIQSRAYTPSASGSLYAAARVSATESLTAPVQIQIISVDTGAVLASTERDVAAGETVEFYTTYRVGSVAQPLTYADLEAFTYGDLDATLYSDHESRPIFGDVIVRVFQAEPTNDVFIVKRLSLYDDPIELEVSVDSGATWWDPGPIANNPTGLFTFETTGNNFCWRLRMYRPGCNVTSVVARPWYYGEGGPVPGHQRGTVIGPNLSAHDHYPPLAESPYWQQWDEPIPRSWYLS
jgi:hypothetical protein